MKKNLTASGILIQQTISCSSSVDPEEHAAVTWNRSKQQKETKVFPHPAFVEFNFKTLKV